LVCAHRWQEKLGVCTSLARLGDDRFADHRGNCIESTPVGIAAAGPARR
jgi:hypothetical protein